MRSTLDSGLTVFRPMRRQLMYKSTADSALPQGPASMVAASKTRCQKASPRLLLVASGGGHWVELLRLRDGWRGKDVAYVTVQADYEAQVPGARFYCVRDATRWSRWGLLQMVAQVAWVVLRERPDVVISSGALPGLVALRVGKWLGARTLWIDSIANVESLSLSGQRALRFADLHLTQWQHLQSGSGATYRGAVL